MDVPAKADVTYVDEYIPSFYGFDGFRKGLRASDFELGKKVPGSRCPSRHPPPDAAAGPELVEGRLEIVASIALSASRGAASNGLARGSRFAAWKTDPPRPAHGDGVGSGAPGALPESVGPPGAPHVTGESAPTPPGTAAGRFKVFAVTPLRGRARANPLDASRTLRD